MTSYIMNTSSWGTQNWNTNFGMSNFGAAPFNWSPAVWSQSANSGSTSSSGAEKKKTFAEMVTEEKLKIKKEEIQKKYKLEELRKEAEEEKKTLEANKNSDGSTSSTVKNKDLGFWGKAGRWLSNAGTAALNIGKSIVGFEKDGSWNPKKCLKNTVIAAVAIGATCIPVVGPAIGYTMLAGGVLAGGVGIAKGVSKLNKAKTDKEIDEAQQEIAGGALIGGLSTIGLKGLGSGLRTGTAASSSVSGASTASSAAARSGFFGKIAEGASNFGRDITINALRATRNAIKYDASLVAANGGGFIGAAKTFGQKAVEGVKDIYSSKERLKRQTNNLETKLTNRLNEINNKLATETDAAKRALLQEEKSMLEFNISEFRSLGTSVKTKADYDKLLTENSGKFNQEYAGTYSRNASGAYEINGTSVSQGQFVEWQTRMNKFQQDYTKYLKNLINAKADRMRSMATSPKKHEADLNEYIPVRNVPKSWKRPKDWLKNEYERAIGGSNLGFWGISLSTAGMVSTFPGVIVTASADKLSNGTLYTAPFLYGMDYTPEEAEAEIKNIDAMIKSYEETENAIKNAKSEEELAAILQTIENRKNPTLTEEAGKTGKSTNPDDENGTGEEKEKT